MAADPLPDLATEPAVTRIQQWLLPITVAVAIGGVIAAGARMALTRRANPLLDVTGGLLTVAAASTLGVTAMALLLKAGDAWSAWVLQVSTGGHFTQRLILALDLGGGAAPAVVLICGTIAIVLSLVQAVLMLFRQAALVILAGVLPLAAAGSVAPMTRTWIRKVTAWMLALICYKPAAAAVYAAAFTMIGSGGSPRTALMGFVDAGLSVVMLPALMKFFTWTTGAIAGSGGGGQFLGAAAVGAIAVGAMRSGPGAGGVGSAGPGRLPQLAARVRRPTPAAGASPARVRHPRPGREARPGRAQRPVRRSAGGPPSGQPASRPSVRGGLRAAPGQPGGAATSAASAAAAAAAAGQRIAGAARRCAAAAASGRGRQAVRQRRPPWPPRAAASGTRLAAGAMEPGDRAMTTADAGPHLRRMAAQPQHRSARPGPGRHPRHAGLFRRC